MNLPRLEFTVPGPPVPKARARTFQARNGRTVSWTPDKTTEFEERVRWRARMALAKVRGWPTGARSYRLTCEFYRPTRRGDLDNFIKAVKDALNPPRGAGRERGRLVWPDDGRVIAYGPMYMLEDSANPRTVVVVEVIEP